MIKAEGVGKEYRIGARAESYATLRETLAGAVRAPLRWAKRRGQAATNSFWALEDVGFEVLPGEVVGVIGRNGAGKSTLLKILSRVTEPTTGRVELYGRVSSLLEVGTGFHPELTGRENIFLNGAILGMHREEIARKFDEIVSFAEVEKFLDTPVKRYSSGMYVRLAFAVAAHLESEIMIVDEVLAVGDAQFQKKCLGKMGDVAKGGRTVLVVSHNIGVVNSLCSRAVYLADGRVRAEGPAEEIVNAYLSETLETKSHDLERLRVSGFGKHLRYLDIGLTSGDGVGNVTFGQPLEFALTVHSDDDLRDLSIGVSIFSVTGACVGSLVTREKFSARADETMRLRLAVSQLSLAPGSYYCSFSVGRGGLDSARVDMEAVVGVPSFQVLPMSDDKDDPVSNWYLSWGSIVFRDARLTVEDDRQLMNEEALKD
ncbi:MAG: ABC transporter ATP-binding protein [Pyrinomonadaceae bacterium]